jgi:uncharacterized protein
MDKIILKGRGLTNGVVEGEALVTTQSFGFSHGVDPTTGKIGDERHELRGQSLKGKVFVFPYCKGSSTNGLFILELVRCGNAPAAVINIDTEPSTGAGFIMGEIFYKKTVPIVDHLDKNPTEVIQTGDWVRVDAAKGTVEVIRKGNVPMPPYSGYIA